MTYIELPMKENLRFKELTLFSLRKVGVLCAHFCQRNQIPISYNCDTAHAFCIERPLSLIVLLCIQVRVNDKLKLRNIGVPWLKSFVLIVAITFHNFLSCRSSTSESPPKSPPKSPVRVSSRNEEQRYPTSPETNHVSTRGQNGESEVQYVRATEVSSKPETKQRDPIQVIYQFRYLTNGSLVDMGLFNK